jgi:hypothetical protein
VAGAVGCVGYNMLRVELNGDWFGMSVYKICLGTWIPIDSSQEPAIEDL